MTIGKSSDKNPPIKTPASDKTSAKNEGKPAHTLNRAERRALARQEKEKLEKEAEAQGLLEKVRSIPLSQLSKQMEARAVETVKDVESSSSGASASSSLVVMKKDLGARPKSTQAPLAIPQVFSQSDEGLTQSLSGLSIEETDLAKTIFQPSKKIEKDEGSDDGEWEVVIDKKKVKKISTSIVLGEHKLVLPFDIPFQSHSPGKLSEEVLAEQKKVMSTFTNEIMEHLIRSNFNEAFRLLIKCSREPGLFIISSNKRLFYRICTHFLMSIYKKNHGISELKIYSDQEILDLIEIYLQNLLNIVGLSNLKLSQFPEVNSNNIDYFMDDKKWRERGNSAITSLSLVFKLCYQYYAKKNAPNAASFFIFYKEIKAKYLKFRKLDDFLKAKVVSPQLFWEEAMYLSDLISYKYFTHALILQKHIESYFFSLQKIINPDFAIVMQQFAYSFVIENRACPYVEKMHKIERLNKGLDIINMGLKLISQELVAKKDLLENYFIVNHDIVQQTKEEYRNILSGLLSTAGHLCSAIADLTGTMGKNYHQLKSKASNLRRNADKLKAARGKKAVKKMQSKAQTFAKLSFIKQSEFDEFDEFDEFFPDDDLE